MNDSTLNVFRKMHEVMSGCSSHEEYLADHSWQWIGKWMSQRMFHLTEERAKSLAARHGGTASKMS